MNPHGSLNCARKRVDFFFSFRQARRRDTPFTRHLALTFARVRPDDSVIMFDSYHVERTREHASQNFLGTHHRYGIKRRNAIYNTGIYNAFCTLDRRDSVISSVVSQFSHFGKFVSCVNYC